MVGSLAEEGVTFKAEKIIWIKVSNQCLQRLVKVWLLKIAKREPVNI